MCLYKALNKLLNEKYQGNMDDKNCVKIQDFLDGSDLSLTNEEQVLESAKK